ncbi:50S ribosomal protein L32 [Corynebacterium uterequi]|uniref:Large ribosomal subunit protein bL32 n=1 Tax=Corynebacterium uterequi TaxID=1072256 RepID=A0A0G3HDC8_9CORY|nr:50S ribosomal protein L32 [Corynebacterium uterequi]AKK10695.1 ribosomal protein L32 [Corynebacterium uterequi]
MATPKFKMSRANTRMRRSQWKANNAALQEVTIDGKTVRIPRRLVRAAKEGLIEVEQF